MRHTAQRNAPCAPDYRRREALQLEIWSNPASSSETFVFRSRYPDLSGEHSGEAVAMVPHSGEGVRSTSRLDDMWFELARPGV